MISRPAGAAGARNLEGLPDAVDDIERRGVAVLDDAEQNRALAVLSHDVLLHRRAVADLADILHEDRCAVRNLDRDVVELVDVGGGGVGVDGVLRVADLGGAGRQRQVLHIDGVDDVQRSEASCQQLGRVEIDHDLPVLAARPGVGKVTPCTGASCWRRR